MSAELGFVLIVAAINAGAALVLGRSATERVPPAGDRTRVALGISAAALGVVVLRFGGALDETLRARSLLAVGGVVIGLGVALLSAEARERALLGETLRARASSTIAPLTLVGATVALLLMKTTSATLLFSFALGGALGSMLGSRSGDPFPLLALATSTVSYACVLVAAHNGASFRDVHRTALIALGPLLPLLASIAFTIGALAVRSDDGEEPDAAIMRGFAVATILGAGATVAASHWWARSSPWLSLPAIAAAVGSLVVLLLGRYYDDPELRAGRAIVRARRGGPSTRRRVGARIGAEGALVMMFVAAGVGFAAFHAAAVVQLDGAGWLGIAIAVAASLASFAFLDAVSRGRDARTLAHDVLLVSLCSVALLSSTYVALATVPIAIALVFAGVVERVAAASEPDEHSETLRRRAAMLPVLAAGMLAAAATFASLFET